MSSDETPVSPPEPRPKGHISFGDRPVEPLDPPRRLGMLPGIGDVDTDLTIPAADEDPLSPPIAGLSRLKPVNVAGELHFDTWAKTLVQWETGEYFAEIYRRAPQEFNFPDLGRKIIVSGLLHPRLHHPPTFESIYATFGGGKVMECLILGPDKTGRLDGMPVVHGRREFSIQGSPKLPVESGSPDKQEDDMSNVAVVTEAIRSLRGSADDAGRRAEVERDRAERITAAEQVRAEGATGAVLQLTKEVMGEKADTFKTLLDEERERATALQAELREARAAMERLERQQMLHANQPSNAASEQVLASVITSAMDGQAKMMGVALDRDRREPPPPSDNTLTKELVRALADAGKRDPVAVTDPNVARDIMREMAEKQGRELSETRQSYQKQLDDMRAAHTHDVAELRTQQTAALDYQRTQHQATVTEMRTGFERALDDCKQNAERTLGSVKEDARRREEDLTKDARRREEELQRARDNDRRDLEARHVSAMESLKLQLDSASKVERSTIENAHLTVKAQLEASRDMERAAATGYQTQMQAIHEGQLASAKAENDRLRDDNKEIKDRLQSVDRDLGNLREKWLEAQAELKIRPQAGPDGDIGSLERLFVLKNKMEEMFSPAGGDDDDEKPEATPNMPWYREALADPTIASLLKGTIGQLTGMNEMEARKEVEIARQATETAKVQALATAATAKARLAASNRGGAGGTAQQQPAVQQVTAQVVRPTGEYQPREDEDPLPDIPVHRPELRGDVAQLKSFLLLAEQIIRQGYPPAMFIEAGARDQGASPAAFAASLKMNISDNIPGATEFLAMIEADGAAQAFPVLFHPVGRRWIKDLFTLIAQAPAVN